MIAFKPGINPRISKTPTFVGHRRSSKGYVTARPISIFMTVSPKRLRHQFLWTGIVAGDRASSRQPVHSARYPADQLQTYTAIAKPRIDCSPCRQNLEPLAP